MSRFEVNFKPAGSRTNGKKKRFADIRFNGRTEEKKPRQKNTRHFGDLARCNFFDRRLVVGFFYWQSIKTTPQYSLALLVDAARRDDQAEIDKLVNVDAVVDDFVPQITDKGGRTLRSRTYAVGDK